MSTDAGTSSTGVDPSFGELKQVDAGVLNVGYVEAGPADGPAVLLLPRMALRHPRLCGRRADARVGRVPRDRAVPARIRHDRFLSDSHAAQRSAVGARRGRDRAHGSPRHRNGDRGWVRLGRADGRHHGGALAGTVHGAGVRERVPDRQSGGQQGAAAAAGRAGVVVPVLLRDRARPGRLRTEPARVRPAHLAHRVTVLGLRRRDVRAQRRVLRQRGSCRHRDPQLPMAARAGRRGTALRRPRTAARRRPRSSACRPSPSKETRMARPTRTRAPTRPSSRARTSTARSRAGSVTICPRRRPPRSPTRSSTSRRPESEL